MNSCASVWNWKATYFATPASVSVGVCLLSPPLTSADSKEATRKKGDGRICIPLAVPCTHFSLGFPCYGADSGARHERHEGRGVL